MTILEMEPREAVQVTDAFGFTDYELGSVLGRYDGKVYETLLEEVRKDPVNRETALKEPILQIIQGKWKSKL